MKFIRKEQLVLTLVCGVCLLAAPLCMANVEHAAGETAKSAHITVQEVKTVVTHPAVTENVTITEHVTVVKEHQAVGTAHVPAEHGEAAVVEHGGGSAAASHGGGHGNSLSSKKLKDLFWRAANFLALVLLLVKFAAKPIGDALGGRRKKIKDELADLESQRDDAKKSYKEFEASLAGMEQEMETLVARAVKQAEAEKVKILEEADRAAVEIKKQAESAIRGELSAAKIELQDDVAEKASVMAEELIVKNLTKADHGNIIENYLDRVGAAQ